ncbi:hypothetical protein [Culturomica sp.]|uniref:hypothetical protein n=1 Tax=Culturomica sp. TaxID=1926652 RepID=UPI00257C77F2|nr:hypothetical protein [Culturomica sp.]
MKMYRFMWLMAMLVVSAAFVACSKDGDDPKFNYDVPYPEIFNCQYYDGDTYVRNISFVIVNPTKETVYWMEFDMDVYLKDELIVSEKCMVGSLADKTEFVVPAKKKIESDKYYIPNMKVKFWLEDIYSFSFSNLRYRTLEGDNIETSAQSTEVKGVISVLP